ncbi:MAG: phosphoribosylamine--glycine ligase [Aureispira sp.]
MKIAVIGSGGREHALSWKLAQTLGQDAVYTLPGSDGIPNSHPMDILDFAAIQQFCETAGIAYVFVGPEVPLAAGIVDFFKDSTIQVLGPSQQAAQLEGSKIFSKQFMERYGVATSPFEAFEKVTAAEEKVRAMKGDLVIKYSGLAGGKGVFVCDNEAEALEALDALREQYGEDCPFLIEEKIVGDELSLIGFTDGKSIRLLLPSQDHKQLLDGDKGPNTGGMGAFCPVPFWTEALAAAIDEKIVAPTLRGIQAEQMDYKGVIYFGIMLGAKGPELLEYNVRFGDPETEVLLPALKTDLAVVVKACLEGRLGEVVLEFEEGYFVDVVQVSGGYPKSYEKGFPIHGLEAAQEKALVFQAGTRLMDGQLCNNGGRVLNIVAQGSSLQEAIDKAYAACEHVQFEGHFYRKDIGQRQHKGLYKS